MSTPVYETIVEESNDGILVAVDGEIVYTNRRLQQLTGYNEDELDGAPKTRIVAPKHQDRVKTYHEQRRNGEAAPATYEVDFETKHGERIPIEVSVNDGEYEGEPASYAICRDVSDLKQQQKELERSRQRFQLAVEGAGVGVWDWNMQTDAVEFNEQWATMLGYSLDEIDPDLDTWKDKTHPEDIGTVFEALEAHAQGETEYYDTDHRMQTADGDWKWIRTLGKIVDRAQDGEPLRAVGLHIDVDEQRRQQKELSELKTRFETFAQTVSEALFLLPVDYSETLYVNDAVERIYGVTPQEAYEDPTVWLQHIHPDDREALRAAMDHFQEGRITGRVSQRYRIQHPDRGLRWVETEMDVVTDNSGTATQIAGITRDITNLKEREQVLEETAQRLTVALEGTNTGVWEWDLETDEVIWTESMQNLFGVTPGTFEGTYDAFAEHVHPDDLPALEESIQKALDNTEPLQAEYRILTDDDRELWGEVRAELVEREDTSQKIVGIVTDITKRKQNERELKRTRELIEKTQENASIGWWEVDLTEETVHWSDEVYRIHDVPLDEEIALDDGINFYHPEAKPIIRDAFEKVTTDGEPYDLELQIVTATDQVRWVRTVGDPLYSDNGDITGVLGIFQDITERKQREETLRQFREAIERTAHAVYITDTDGIIEYVNPAFEEITGFTADEAIGQTPRIFYSGKHDSNYYEKFWETIETGSQWESEMVNTRADGKEIILNQTVAPILNDDGVPEKYVAIARDIIERKQYEQKLKDARKNLRDVIDLIPDIIALKDKDGRYLLANQTTAETYGITVEELEGTLEKDIIPSPEEAEKFRQDDLEVIESGEPKHIPEEELTTANGETKILQTTKIPYKTNGGGTDAVLLYARDITALKQYEQQLETQRDNLDLLNQVVRHDIRNDLQLIQAYGGMLAEVDSLSEQQQLFISKVLKAANNAVDLTTSARDLSEVMLRDETETKPMPLAQTVEQQVDRLQSETQSAIVTIDGLLPAVDVVADELLEAVFRNLLKNAVQHNDKDVPEITISASVDNHQVIVNVADNGPGVSDAHKTEIFGRGNQGLKSEGTGIGLHLVQTLVDRYGGSVWVEDNDPDGAVFAVELQVDS